MEVLNSLVSLFYGFCYIFLFFVLLAIADKYITKTKIFQKILKGFEKL